jgi:hypothetical protein
LPDLERHRLVAIRKILPILEPRVDRSAPSAVERRALRELTSPFPPDGRSLVLLPATTALAWKKHWLAGVTLLALGAGVMFGLLKPTLKSLSEWERAARYSRQLTALLNQNDYPANSIVVFNSLPDVQTWYRHWSLPFAMEPPFVNLRGAIRFRLELVLL